VTVLSWITYFLSSVGAINWGLTFFLKLNLIEEFCKMVKINYLREIIYGTISLCGFYLLLSLFIK